MATLIITEKTSQAKDLAVALGDRFGQILPAEGHLLRLAEPDEVNAGWKSWSCVLLKPDSLYPTRPAAQGNKPAKLKAIADALKTCDHVIFFFRHPGLRPRAPLALRAHRRHAHARHRLPARARDPQLPPRGLFRDHRHCECRRRHVRHASRPAGEAAH